MPDRKKLVEDRARDLARELSSAPGGPVRVEVRDGPVVVLVCVCPATFRMPTAASPAGAPPSQVRCEGDMVRLLADAGGEGLCRKNFVSAARAAGMDHKPGTIAKALAALVRQGRMVNRRGSRGYAFRKRAAEDAPRLPLPGPW